MNFHLNYSPKPSDFKISHSTPIMLLGSCFSENIGLKLSDYQFQILNNPSGILYNPISIYDALLAIVEPQTFNEKWIFKREELFLSFRHHSSMSSFNKEELISNIESQAEISRKFLKNATVLFLSFGTAFSYFHKELNITVANCHKQNGNLFTKKILPVDEIVKTYVSLISKLLKFNPLLKIVFTVSPVKHLRDGIEENSLSKATLLLGIHQLISQQQNCFYFPSFELVNDDLRDYRFYKEDLAHPNELAIAYIWEKFSVSYFDAKTILLNKKIEALNQALKHKPSLGGASETQKLQSFISGLKIEIAGMLPSED